MRATIRIITCALAGVLAVGCNSTDSSTKARTETKEAIQAVKDHAYTQKTEFVAERRAELADLNQQLDELSDKVERSSDSVKAEAAAALAAARGKWAQAKDALDKAESATESTWDGIKNDYRKAHGELKDSFESSREWLSEKIAP